MKLKRHASKFSEFIRVHFFSSRARTISTIIVLIAVPMIIVQLLQPSDTLLPNTKVGSVKIGGETKAAAVETLDKAYATTKVPVYFSDSDEVVTQPTFAKLGVTTNNEARVADFTYPLFWRLIPGSLFWNQAIWNQGEPAVSQDDATFNAYMLAKYGPDCTFEPVNGTVSYVDGSLQAVDAERGGSCDINELSSSLKAVSVSLSPQKVTVAGTSTAPTISTETAQKEFERLSKQLGEGVELKVADATEVIPADTVVQWVEYSVDNGALVVGLNSEKSAQWLKDTYGEKFTSDPGTTVVTMLDFTEKSRETGKSGQALNTSSTIGEITKDLKGEADTATLVVDSIEPKVTYKRTYSPTNEGLAAVMKNYADTHAGTYGVKLVELSGARRNAEYNSTSQFTTASTYKLFVAYSILLRIERGDLHWSDASYGGYTLSTCFDRMISLSNNECAVDLLLKVGRANLDKDAHAIGAKSTTFMGGGDIKSTASDEALLLSLLYTGQILTQQSSRDKMITAMKNNVYVSGIPSGLPKIEVADKVGFLYALLHDAAIVYSPKGTYVLIILTDHATWGNIAELAKELEAVR